MPAKRPLVDNPPASGFSRLIAADLSDRRPRMELVEPLTFTHWLNGDGFSIRVPQGFVTDFASTPWLLWRIFPPMGRWNRAAVLHDYLYSLPTPKCSRFLADALFREAMHRLGVPVWRRVLMYYAVRLFGWMARRKSQEAAP